MLFIEIGRMRKVLDEIGSHCRDLLGQADKTYRRAERQYNAERRERIENLNTNNPKSFWDEVNKLGPRPNKSNDYRTKTKDGNLETNGEKIKEQWQKDFSNLYNTSHSSTFNENFLHAETENNRRYNQQEAPEMENEETKGDIFVSKDAHTYVNLDSNLLNLDITIEEVKWATSKAKNNKSSGYDNIANEILKSPTMHKMLEKLFAYCFKFGITPDQWFDSIITPIYKPGKPKNEPLSHRGISLMSSTAKIFTSILNNRIKIYLESNQLLAEEQNGFRSGRSCQDHIFTLTTLLCNRMNDKKPTYTCFVDFSKAFNCVNHELLWSTIRRFGINGRMYKVIQYMYSNLKASVNLGGYLTNWFRITGGVRQGDNLAPTLFAIFINSLAECINNLNCGVQVEENLEISILMYADDIVLISETEEGLQHQLNALENWMNDYRMSVNMDKTRVVHFRKPTAQLTKTQFKLRNQPIVIATEYKYLGLTLTEHLNYKQTAEILASSGSRALGALTAKYLHAKGLMYKTYTKLYNSTVIPVLHYASAIWGTKTYDKQEQVHHRAMRLFLGTGKKAPLPGLYGDMGWHKLKFYRKREMVGYWLKLFNMQNTRITKKVFNWDYRRALLGKKGWNRDVRNILESTNMQDLFYGLGVENIAKNLKDLNKELENIEQTSWHNEVNGMPKLRTYKTLKLDYGTELYTKTTLNKYHRSLIAKTRLGTLPINIETGRYKKQPIHERTCPNCTQEIEDEEHFILKCPLYDKDRQAMFGTFNEKTNNSLEDLGNQEKMYLLFNIGSMIKPLAKFIEGNLNTRTSFLKNKK